MLLFNRLVKAYPVPGWNKADAFEFAFELLVDHAPVAAVPAASWVFVVTDSLFNMAPNPSPSWFASFMEYIFQNVSVDGVPVVSRIGRLMIADQKKVHVHRTLAHCSETEGGIMELRFLRNSSNVYIYIYIYICVCVCVYVCV